jgi:CxxC motif-containing protein
MEKRKMICIRCPRGCEITTSLDGAGAITAIEGNVCKLGEDYVGEEILDPRRIITSTVRVRDGVYPLVSVWTDRAIPKAMIFELMSELREVELVAPVKEGETVIDNLFGLGVKVITSNRIQAKKNKVEL